jgi:hypothetical protein
MSAFKVERDEDGENKSIQEVEEKLLQEKEELDSVVEQVVEEVITSDPITAELDDNVVLSHINTRYGKEITSIDELFQTRNDNEELPEDVRTYLKYKKDTGRGFDDFNSLNRDYDKLDPTNVLREYLKIQNPEFDDSDIDFEMESFQAPEYADDREVKQKEILLKKELKKAKDYFNGLKEQYKVPLESSAAFVPESEKESYESFKQYTKTLEDTQAQNSKRSEVFTEKTASLFSNNFEGFEINVGGQTMKYKPADAATLKEQQSNLSNFVGKFLDENNTLKDAEGFHRAIAIANDTEKFADYIWQAARAAEAEDQSKNAKNIDMVRKPQQSTPKSGFTVEIENDSNVSQLRMKTRKH